VASSRLCSYYDTGDAPLAVYTEIGHISYFESFEPDVVAVQIDGARIRLEPGQSVIAHGPDGRSHRCRIPPRKTALTVAYRAQPHGSTALSERRTPARRRFEGYYGADRDLEGSGAGSPSRGPIECRWRPPSRRSATEASGAVYLYQIESYRYWQEQLKRSHFAYGQFGENFTIADWWTMRCTSRSLSHRRGAVRGDAAAGHVLSRRHTDERAAHASAADVQRRPGFTFASATPARWAPATTW
jgi:hypothetical protein